MSNRLGPHLALLAVQILFGIWPIFGKVVLRSMSSTSLVALRITGAALALALLQRRLAPLLRMPMKDIVLLILCSLLGIVGNQFLFVKGLSLTTVINAEILSTTIPAYALTISILLGYDRWSFKTVGGILIAAAGVLYLINPARADLTTTTTTGNVLILINSFLYAVFIVISKGLYERYGALNMITWIFVVGLFVTIPVGIFSLQQENLAAIDAYTWLALAFIILLPTVGAYYLNAWALTRVSPSTVAIYIYLQPLIAFGFAPLLLGEKWNYRTIVAALLIFGGVALVTTNRDTSAHVSVST
ncbi:MAG TPA: DMT family transporter [Pyrinomonadaceae bacterium]|nr:DMT family transporter [Pyrinomonadaceae bacterium]